MKIDYDYLKDNILGPILDSKEIGVCLQDYCETEDADNPDFKKYVFHINLLNDAGYIVKTSGNFGEPIGLTSSGVYISPVNHRLSSTGQDFAENLCSAPKSILNKITGYGLNVATQTLPSLLISAISQ